MPLFIIGTNEDVIIQKIGGNEKEKNHLMSMGFVVGEKIKVDNKIDYDVIVIVKGNKMALGKDMAKRIIVSLK